MAEEQQELREWQLHVIDPRPPQANHPPAAAAGSARSRAERRGRRAKQRIAHSRHSCTARISLHYMVCGTLAAVCSRSAVCRLLLSSAQQSSVAPVAPFTRRLPSSSGAQSQVRSNIKLRLAAQTKQWLRDDHARPCSHPPSVCWLSLRRCCCRCCCHWNLDFAFVRADATLTPSRNHALRRIDASDRPPLHRHRPCTGPPVCSSRTLLSDSPAS